MALLTPHDELSDRPARIIVAGTSGSGKSTLARKISTLLEIPHIEIDALHHGPNWKPRPTFLDDVRQFAGTERWVTEWQYAGARPLLADRADLMISLDMPLWVVMTRITRRTLSRRLHQTELWNGNVEAPLHTFFTNPDHIIRWAWRTYTQHPPRVIELMEQHPSLPAVRLRTRAEVDQWLAGPLARATCAS